MRYNMLPEKTSPTLRSAASKEHTRVPGSEDYCFCEPTTAVFNNWHIRRLDDTGKHTGGGITTPSLCGMVKPLTVGGMGGWDVSVDITQHHGEHNCQECWKLLQAELIVLKTTESRMAANELCSRISSLVYNKCPGYAFPKIEIDIDEMDWDLSWMSVTRQKSLQVSLDAETLDITMLWYSPPDTGHIIYPSDRQIIERIRWICLGDT